jgi:hypothetical protein
VNVFACIVTTTATDPDVTVTRNGGEENPPDDAVMFAVPGLTPMMRPVEFTLTTAADELTYVILAFGAASPFTSLAVAVSCTASPTAIVCLPVMITELMTGASRPLSPLHADNTAMAIRIAAALMYPQRLAESRSVCADGRRRNQHCTRVHNRTLHPA